MAFTPDGIAPPGIPLLGCSPPHHYEVQNGLGGSIHTSVHPSIHPYLHQSMCISLCLSRSFYISIYLNFYLKLEKGKDEKGQLCQRGTRKRPWQITEGDTVPNIDRKRDRCRKNRRYTPYCFSDHE